VISITDERIVSPAHPGKRYASQDGQKKNDPAKQEELNRWSIDSSHEGDQADRRRNSGPKRIGTALGDAVRVDLRRATSDDTANKNRQKNQIFHGDFLLKNPDFLPD